MKIFKGSDIILLLEKSKNWKHWMTMRDAKVCGSSLPKALIAGTCHAQLGKIYGINDVPNPAPPLHPNCRCVSTATIYQTKKRTATQ